jgi:hypothetical protein
MAGNGKIACHLAVSVLTDFLLVDYTVFSAFVQITAV